MQRRKLYMQINDIVQKVIFIGTLIKTGRFFLEQLIVNKEFKILTF